MSKASIENKRIFLATRKDLGGGWVGSRKSLRGKDFKSVGNYWMIPNPLFVSTHFHTIFKLKTPFSTHCDANIYTLATAIY